VTSIAACLPMRSGFLPVFDALTGPNAGEWRDAIMIDAGDQQRPGGPRPSARDRCATRRQRTYARLHRLRRRTAAAQPRTAPSLWRPAPAPHAYSADLTLPPWAGLTRKRSACAAEHGSSRQRPQVHTSVSVEALDKSSVDWFGQDHGRHSCGGKGQRFFVGPAAGSVEVDGVVAGRDPNLRVAAICCHSFESSNQQPADALSACVESDDHAE
jgi:hypothetical protein